MSGFSLSHSQDHTRNRIDAFYAEQSAGTDESINWLSWLIRLAVLTGLAIFSIFLYYTAIHYLQPRQAAHKAVVVKDLTVAPSPIATQKAPLMAPLANRLQVKRIHMQRGQALNATYLLPEGVSLKLEIQRCAESFLTEIFNCNVVGKESVVIDNDMSGTYMFKYQGEGFYMFKETLTLKDDYKLGSGRYHVTWNRS